MGALAAGSTGTDRRSRWGYAAIGAVAAIAATYLSYGLRALAYKAGKPSGMAAGVLEDAALSRACDAVGRRLRAQGAA